MDRCPLFSLLPSNWSQFSPFQVKQVIFAEDRSELRDFVTSVQATFTILLAKILINVNGRASVGAIKPYFARK
jgi:hypothetical protein